MLYHYFGGGEEDPKPDMEEPSTNWPESASREGNGRTAITPYEKRELPILHVTPKGPLTPLSHTERREGCYLRDGIKAQKFCREERGKRNSFTHSSRKVKGFIGVRSKKGGLTVFKVTPASPNKRGRPFQEPFAGSSSIEYLDSRIFLCQRSGRMSRIGWQVLKRGTRHLAKGEYMWVKGKMLGRGRSFC